MREGAIFLDPKGRNLVIIGAGGHAKMVIELLYAIGRSYSEFNIIGLTDSNPARWGHSLFTYKVLGDDTILAGLKLKGVMKACMGIGSNSAGGNRHRAGVYERICKDYGFIFQNLVHPQATLALTSEYGKEQGLVMMPGARVNSDVHIGNNVLINTGAIVEHDCFLSDHCHICPGAVLGGGVEVGEGAFVGLGAMVLPGVTIGAWATVGAGAVVLNNVPYGATVVGNPAMLLRPPSERLPPAPPISSRI